MKIKNPWLLKMDGEDSFDEDADLDDNNDEENNDDGDDSEQFPSFFSFTQKRKPQLLSRGSFLVS